MRSRVAVLPLLLLAVPLFADDFCATGPATEQRLRALRERREAMRRVSSQATVAPATLINGAFYVPNDDTIAPGRRAFDLANTSLTFEPRAGNRYAVRRGPLAYVEPAGAARKVFSATDPVPWHHIAYDLTSFQFPLFGQQVSRVYLSAFNGIHTAPPPTNATWQFDELEAAVFRGPVLSPLMLTIATPVRYFSYPSVFVDETADALRVTWRTPSSNFFYYDVQAELRKDGTIVYSYRQVSNIEWGTPIVSQGFDAWNPAARLLGSANDTTGDVSVAAGNSAPMVDIKRVEVHRLGETELFVIRIQVAAPLDATKLFEATDLRFIARIGSQNLEVNYGRSGVTTRPPAASAVVPGGATGRVNGDLIEIFATQKELAGAQTMRIFTLMTNSTRTWDQLTFNVNLDEPGQSLSRDLSAVTAGAEVAAPILEPFVLPELDVFAVWEKIAAKHRLRHDDVDGMAIFQSFYTDIIFYAGAYSTGGNPQVDGVANFDPEFWGTTAPREASMLHMNQLNYNYNSVESRASQVMMHEFGHRWLYFSRIRENGATSTILNPLSAHPAQYVHLPAAFPVYAADESSVMGGAFFLPQSDGTWKAHVANAGYSWLDLYLMGLATPEEVAPWFYLANTNPPLGGAYWPEHGIVVSGTKTDVVLDQLISVHGPRNPTTAFSQKGFRVLFALVTPEGTAPTPAEQQKLTELRSLLERNFTLATGGRGKVWTNFVLPTRRRSADH